MRAFTLIRNSTVFFKSNRFPLLICARRALCQSTFSNLDRKFTKKHEWISFDSDQRKEGIVGITKPAEEALGDVVFIELPDVGTHLKAGEAAGAIESVKAASDVYSPVSGEVIEKNTQVESNPHLVNIHCYTKGWLYKLKIEDSTELESLMTEEEYESFRKNEEKSTAQINK